MNTYMALITAYKKYYGYANVKFINGQLILTFSRGVRPTFKKKINLESIHDCIKKVDLYGARRISFMFNNNQYVFFENGNGIIDYLSKNFKFKMAIKR